MSLKYKTKPLTLADSIDKIWEILVAQDELNRILLQENDELKRRVNRLEAEKSGNKEVTKRLK